MIKKQLSGNTQTISLEGLECPEKLIFANFGKNTKVKIEVQRVGEDNEKITDTIKVLDLAVSTKKIFSTSLNLPYVPPIIIDGLVKQCEIVIALDGEISLGIDDKLVISLSDMANSGGHMFVKGGQEKSSNLFKFLKENFDGRNDEKRIDVSKYSFLAFTEDSMPQSVERFYEGETKRDTAEEIILIDDLNYGASLLNAVGGSDDGDSVVLPSIYAFDGAKAARVLEVRGLQTLVLKSDTGADWSFYGVKVI